MVSLVSSSLPFILVSSCGVELSWVIPLIVVGWSLNIGLRGSRLSISVVLPDAELCTLVGTDSSDSTESKSDDSSVFLLESEQLKASSFVFPWLVVCFGLRMLSLSFLSFLRGVSADEVVDESDSSSLFLR